MADSTETENEEINSSSRVIGMKREGGTSGAMGGTNQMILRQFLLLLPFECTFSDLKVLVLAQYQKLYKNQPGYLQLKNILHFRDVNQCDLDLDYLVADICASNDLIYVMVEIDDNSNSNNKKLKTSEFNSDILNVKKNNGNNNNVTASTKPVPVPKVIVSQPETKPNPSKPVISDSLKNGIESKAVKLEIKNEKKVPEFKPSTPIVVPTAKNSNTNTKNNVNVPIVVNTNSNNSGVISDVVVSAVASKTTPSSANINDQSKPKPVVTPKLIQIPTQRITETTNTIIKPVESKTEEIKKKEVEAVGQVNVKDIIKVDNDNLLNSITIAETSVLCNGTTNTSSEDSDSVNNEDVNFEDKNRSNTMITPSPTPIPRPTPIISRPIFNPRKISPSPTCNNNSNSSDSEESSDEETILKGNFDASSLFGSQIITSEPRRSDAFVLFEAGSSGSSSDESVSAVCNNNPTTSSIVSLQAEPSSELDNDTLESSSSEEDDNNNNGSEINSNLPQSVTLRRMSSVSPIPDPSEMPSLDELKESLNRAPTPIQILQSDKNLKLSVKKKANHHYHHQNNSQTQSPTHNQTQTQAQAHTHTHTHSHNSNRGRPAKKAHRGRPKASL